MADKKIEELSQLIVDSLTALDGVSFPISASTYSEAKRILLTAFMQSTTAVGSSIDYKLLTPAGFAASVANSANAGISRFATDTEINEESIFAVGLSPGDLPLIRENILKLWASELDGVSPFYANTIYNTGAGYQFSKYIESVDAGTEIAFTPDLGGKTLCNAAIQIAIYSDQHNKASFMTIPYSASGQTINISDNFRFIVPSSRTSITLKFVDAQTNIRVSASVNLTCKA